MNNLVSRVAGSKMLTREIKTIAGLQSISSDIEAFLAQESVVASIYHRPGYMESVIEHELDIVDWRIVVVEQESQIVALFPFYVKDSKFPIKCGVFTFFSPRVKQLRLFGNAMAFLKDCNQFELHKTIELYVRAITNSFDLGFIEAVPLDSPLFQCFSAKENLNLEAAYSRNDVVRYLDFPGSWDMYLGGMRKKKRYNLKSNVKRLETKYGEDLKLVHYESVEDVEQFCCELDEVYRESWQASTYGYKSRVSPAELAKNKAIAATGGFKSFVLKAKNEAVAFVRGYQYKGFYYFEEIGYKQKMSNDNVGSALNFLVFKQLADSEDRPSRLSFGYGENTYKQIYGTGAYEATNAYLYRKGSKGEKIFRTQKFLNLIYQNAREGFVKFNLDNKVRKLLKRRSK